MLVLPNTGTSVHEQRRIPCSAQLAAPERDERHQNTPQRACSLSCFKVRSETRRQARDGAAKSHAASRTRPTDPCVTEAGGNLCGRARMQAAAGPCSWRAGVVAFLGRRGCHNAGGYRELQGAGFKLALCRTSLNTRIVRGLGKERALMMLVAKSLQRMEIIEITWGPSVSPKMLT